MFKNNLTCVPSSNDVTVVGKSYPTIYERDLF